MPDPAALLDQSIRLGLQSILLQLEAKAAIQPPRPPPGIICVRPGDDLPSVLAGLSGGEVVFVSPEVVTSVADLTLDKPVTLVGATITAIVDVTAPDVTLHGCTITGSRAEGAIVATADRLKIRHCRLHGSPYGQHRGVYVRSADVSITDTEITGCAKSGQEAQAIAGWACVRRLLVERCLLEGAGENFILGGADCAETEVPEDIIVRGCTLRKPTAWRNCGYVVKNLLELKNARRVLIENNVLENVWVEGQTGFALVLTPRNQDGSAPWSTVEDVTIRHNTIRHMAAGIQLLGTDYTHPSQLMSRITIEDNVFEDISAAWGNNGRVFQFSHGGEAIAFRRNTCSGTDINSFLTFEGAPLTHFVFEGNRVPEGWYGIKADDTAIGTATLDKYAPGGTYASNTVVRTTSNNYPYPAGFTVVAG
jgi:Right handed beta helix region